MSMSVDFHANNLTNEESKFNVKTKVWDGYVTISLANTWRSEVSLYLSPENLDTLIHELLVLKSKWREENDIVD